MATLVLNDVPQAVLDDLARRASAEACSLPQATLAVLCKALQSKQPDNIEKVLPEMISESEQTDYVDLPFSVPGVPVTAIPGEPAFPENFEVEGDFV